MRKEPKPSSTESPLLFEVDPKPLEETLTALEGTPLVVQAFRSLGSPESVRQQVCVKERERGYDEATFVGSLVILYAAAGQMPGGFGAPAAESQAGGDGGARVPSPEAAPKFLYAFHEEEKIEKARRRRLPGEIA
jgi:hypothetical protein